MTSLAHHLILMMPLFDALEEVVFGDDSFMLMRLL
jgi:hypothetical protein